MNSYEVLAKAIIMQAVRDWRASQAYLKTHCAKKEDDGYEHILACRRMKADCERFFHSEWFTELSGLNGEMLLNRLRKEADAT